MTTPGKPRFVRLPPAEETPGCRQYRVLVDGQQVASVSQRRGGYWSATGIDGRSSSSYCRTRAEAVSAVLPTPEEP